MAVSDDIVGTVGADGIAGAVGTAGIAGALGAVGIAGALGAAGIAGAVGTAGIAGAVISSIRPACLSSMAHTRPSKLLRVASLYIVPPRAARDGTTQIGR